MVTNILCISLLKTTWQLKFSELVNILNLSPLRVWFQESPLSSKLLLGWHEDNLLKPNICYQTRAGLAPTLRQCFAVLVSSFARRRLLLVELLRNFVQRKHLKLILVFVHTQSFLEWLNIWPLPIVLIRFKDWNRTWSCSYTSSCWDDVTEWIC